MLKKRRKFMSMYLFDEQPIVGNKALARELGLNEALILQQINYWIEINKKSGNNYYEGRYWTYNSIRAWQENDFDYMSIDTVKRTFAKLEKLNYLLVGNFNKDPRDKTKWYTINEEKLKELYFDIEKKKRQKELEALENKELEPMPNELGQNAPMEKCKMPQCNNADCTNASVQNPPMHSSKMPQALPEITTNNTSYNNAYISSEISTHPSVLTDEKDNIYKAEGGEVDNKYKICLERLREQAGYYEQLKLDNEFTARSYDEIIRVLADIMVLDENDIVMINHIKMPAKLVQERFKELNSSHIEYIVEIIKENKTKIRNVRAFILTVAYNAPSGMDAYYTATAGYDMRGGF